MAYTPEKDISVQASAFKLTHQQDLLLSYVQNLFFPGRLIQFSSIASGSPRVRMVQIQDGEEFVTKTFRTDRYPRELVAATQEWSDRVSQASGITAARFLLSVSGDFFPLVHTDSDMYLSVMEKVDNQQFELEDMRDLERMGIAIALLHQAASTIDTAHIRRFAFSRTNPDVERYWELQDAGEMAMFERILQVPNSFDQLPTQLTHNDVHPVNLLSHGGVPFFIDFDQMLVGPRVNDIGQAISAFWIDDSPDGFETEISAFINGYSKIAPLSVEEIHAIPLFALRKICISFVWFKGLAQHGDPEATKLYELTLKRVHTLNSYLEQHGYFDNISES